MWNVLELEPEEKKRASFHFKLLGLVAAAATTAWAGGYAAREHFNSELAAAQKSALAAAEQKIKAVEEQIKLRASARDKEMEDVKLDYRTGIARIERKVDGLSSVILERLPPPAKRVSRLDLGY